MPRFSRAKTYEPPLEAYALTPWLYESTTIASRTATASEIGSTKCSEATPAVISTAIAASLA